MRYLDYDWDLYPNCIILDKELNYQTLGWKHGDHFKVVEQDGQCKLVKVDPVVVFAQGYDNE